MSADRVTEEGHRPAALPSEPLLGPASRSNKVRLDRVLRGLELLLWFLGYHPSTSVFSVLPCFLTSILLGLAVPISSFVLSRSLDGGYEDHHVWMFELWVLISQVVLAAISIICVSINLCSGGLRMFLFLDEDHERMERFREKYVESVEDFFKKLLCCTTPCLLVNIIRQGILFQYSTQYSLWKSIVTRVASILGWSYLTSAYISACALFNLVCNIQIIHLEYFGNKFEIERDWTPFLGEHCLLRDCLTQISHMFRNYLLFAFLFVSFSQVIALFLTMGYAGTINFINAGGLGVSSVLNIVGMILCLCSASKISHRAQAIASLAGKWNASITCEANDQSEVNVPMAHSLSSYHKRQSLVTYFQGNPGGITIYGLMVDRTLIISIIFFELSLVLFVLGSTIGLVNDQTDPV